MAQLHIVLLVKQTSCTSCVYHSLRSLSIREFHNRTRSQRFQDHGQTERIRVRVTGLLLYNWNSHSSQQLIWNLPSISRHRQTFFFWFVFFPHQVCRSMHHHPVALHEICKVGIAMAYEQNSRQFTVSYYISSGALFVSCAFMQYRWIMSRLGIYGTQCRARADSV